MRRSLAIITTLLALTPSLKATPCDESCPQSASISTSAVSACIYGIRDFLGVKALTLDFTVPSNAFPSNDHLANLALVMGSAQDSLQFLTIIGFTEQVFDFFWKDDLETEPYNYLLDLIYNSSCLQTIEVSFSPAPIDLESTGNLRAFVKELRALEGTEVSFPNGLLEPQNDQVVPSGNRPVSRAGVVTSYVVPDSQFVGVVPSVASLEDPMGSTFVALASVPVGSLFKKRSKT